MKPLDKEQAAFIGAYTGVCFGPFSDIHELAEEVMGRPIWTHEFASEEMFKQLREKLRPRIEEIVYKEDEDDHQA